MSALRCELLSIRERPALLDRAAAWFHGKWGVPLDAYRESMEQSLSGGESFKASLSLALGLADEIQSRSGGIRLDTMFVDEGFGSLDESALEQAVQALLSLSEGSRLVGIISHVNELKEQIERKLVVTRSEKGSAAKWA